MRCKSHKQAMRQARRNADRFGKDYVVFADPSGSWNCERRLGRNDDVYTVVEPRTAR